jgi:hypothetical protein
MTRGYTVGGRPGRGRPSASRSASTRLLTLAVDYAPLTWVGEPRLRGTINVRKRFAVPVPFVRGTPLGGPAIAE